MEPMVTAPVLVEAAGEADAPAWDAFVAAHPHGHILQSWRWGDFKREYGWDVVRLWARRGPSGPVVGVVQALLHALPGPLGASRLAYVPKGPVVEWEDIAAVATLLAALDAEMRRRHAVALRIEPELPATTAVEATLRRHGFVPTREWTQPLTTYHVDLRATPEEIARRFKNKWRYNVNLARRKGVTIRAAAGPEDVAAWYRLLLATCERDNFTMHDERYYSDLWRLFQSPEQARLFLAEYEGELLAGIFVVVFGGMGWYLYGASGNSHRNLMPNHLLQWEAMLWCRERGATVYDMWGIPNEMNEHDPLWGVWRFKQGFGGEIVRYAGCYDRSYLPVLYDAAAGARRYSHALRRWWRMRQRAAREKGKDTDAE